MARGIALANHERRNYRRARRHRDSSDSVAGACLHSKEIDEHSVAHIEVERDRDLPFPPEILHQRETRLFALDNLGTEAGPHAADFAIDSGIAQWAMDHRERMPIHRMRERQQLEI